MGGPDTVTLKNGFTPSDQALTCVIAIMLLLIWCLQNLRKIDAQGDTSTFGGLFQILVALLIIGSAFVFTPKLSSTKFVFTQFTNETGFSS
jgi:hypothetical protein